MSIGLVQALWRFADVVLVRGVRGRWNRVVLAPRRWR